MQIMDALLSSCNYGRVIVSFVFVRSAANLNDGGAFLGLDANIHGFPSATGVYCS